MQYKLLVLKLTAYYTLKGYVIFYRESNITLSSYSKLSFLSRKPAHPKTATHKS